ncbi:insulinase family protein, partial [Mariniblastus sp.]
VGRDPGTLVAMMEIKKDVKIEAATKILLDTIQAIGKDGVTEAEVKRAVTEFLKNRENLQANPERLAIQLSEWASYGDWRLFFLHRDRLEKVSPDDVKRVASDYLKTSNRTVGTFRPTKTPDRAVIPNTPDITNLVKDYKGRKSITEGESFESTPANIANRLVNGKFSSGVSYALLPKQTRLNRVFMRLTLRYGNEGFLAKNRLNDACDMLPNLWFKGTTSLTFQELQDKINELKASISVSGSTGQVTFNVSGRKETFSEVLKLLKDVLQNPAFPEDEFKILKSQSLTSMESAKSDPRYLGQIALMRKMRPVPKNNIRYVPTVEENVERIEKLSIGDIKEVYNRCLSGTVGEVTIVGAFDQEETITLVDDLLEDWKPEVPYQRIEDQFLVTKKDNISINTPDKKMAVLYAGTNLKIRDDDQDWEAMFIANNILGGGALANRLGERVRQKEGLSYGVGSMFSADSLDQVGRFMTQAITNPKNRDRLVEVIQEEYQRFIDGGVSPDELERAKTGYIEQVNGILGKDQQLLGILHRFQRTGRQPDFLARRLANVSRLTKTDVDRAIKKLLPLDRIVIVTAGDFENNPPATANDNPTEKKD